MDELPLIGDAGDSIELGGDEEPLDPVADEMVVQWLGQEEALRVFATTTESTQSARHIKPLHHYIACRLVVEGGFRPDEITPRPPFDLKSDTGRKPRRLLYAPERAGKGELSILGGLKTKKVNVVVNKPGIGPVLAVSCKGMTGALRNLTNRMEETIGETTNLHMTYPALVFGYFFLVRANRTVEEAADEAAAAESDDADAAMKRNDVALEHDGSPVQSLLRFDAALRGMTGRRSLRDDVSRYESIALALVDVDEHPGRTLPEFPAEGSGLRIDEFFLTLYARYDERFVISAPVLSRVTRRLEWHEKSPALGPLKLAPGLSAFSLPKDLSYTPRIG